MALLFMLLGLWLCVCVGRGTFYVPKNKFSIYGIFCIFFFSKCFPSASPLSGLALTTLVILAACVLLQLCGKCTLPCGSTLQRLCLPHGRTVHSANRERLIASPFHAICLTWTHSKHYGFAGRMVFLLQKFCNLLIDRVRKICIWVTAEKLDVSLMGL